MKKRIFTAEQDGFVGADGGYSFINDAVYTPLSVTEEAFEKKGLFHWSKA